MNLEANWAAWILWLEQQGKELTDEGGDAEEGSRADEPSEPIRH